jgi:hypothetical protein
MSVSMTNTNRHYCPVLAHRLFPIRNSEFTAAVGTTTTYLLTPPTTQWLSCTHHTNTNVECQDRVFAHFAIYPNTETETAFLCLSSIKLAFNWNWNWKEVEVRKREMGPRRKFLRFGSTPPSRTTTTFHNDALYCAKSCYLSHSTTLFLCNAEL